jgi:hypothetical protein
LLNSISDLGGNSSVTTTDIEHTLGSAKAQKGKNLLGHRVLER